MQSAVDGSLTNVGSVAITYPNPSVSQVFSGTLDTAPINAVRAYISGSSGTVFSAWTTVIDSYVAPSVSIKAASIGRDDSTGFLTYDVTSSSAAYFSANGVCRLSGFACLVGFQAKLASGGAIENLAQATISYPTPGVHQEFTGSVDTAKVSQVRAYVSGNSGTLFGSWVTVPDPYRSPTTGVTVTSIQPGTAVGTLAYDITAQSAAYWSTNGQCALPGWGCTIGVQAQYGAANSIMTVDSTQISYPGPSVAHEFTGTATISGITAVRSVVIGHAGELDGPWTTVSSNVQNGVDVAAAIAGILLIEPYAADVCFTLFQRGTHFQGSTVSDQELACNAAGTGAGALGGYLAALVAQYGGQILLPLEVIAARLVAGQLAQANGVTTSPTGQSVLPKTCAYVGIYQISCGSGGVNHLFEDPNGPTTLDPVITNNLAERFLANVPEGKIPTIPSNSPLANASPLQWATAMTDECLGMVNSVDPTPGKNGATFGTEASATDDDCASSAIFFTGANSPLASAHDLAAIIANPQWLVLHYASETEKAGRVPPEKRKSWAGTPPCPASYDYKVSQCDEYPYFATDEGYPVANPPSLAFIPAGDNGSQGGSYSQFVTTQCPDIKASAQKTKGRKFLVIPIHTLLLPTVYYCGTQGVTQ